MNEPMPLARTSDIVVLEIKDETLVYDLRVSKAHCLNETAASVWKLCDGERTITDISALMEDQHNTSVGRDFVQLALDQLEERNLLANSGVNHGRLTNRRQMIKQVGIAGVIAAPIIASLVVPNSVYASVSCACVNPGACLTQTACPNTTNCNSSGICAP
jgi:hypothetical protein